MAGRKLRKRFRLRGQVDAEALALGVGLAVDPWPFETVDEVKIGNHIAVASRLSYPWRRWCIAHAIGHHFLHPGNHLWLRAHTGLALRFEREAEDFAYGLLIDEEEALIEQLRETWEVAEHFGVPEEPLLGRRK